MKILDRRGVRSAASESRKREAEIRWNTFLRALIKRNERRREKEEKISASEIRKGEESGKIYLAKKQPGGLIKHKCPAVSATLNNLWSRQGERKKIGLFGYETELEPGLAGIYFHGLYTLCVQRAG